MNPLWSPSPRSSRRAGLFAGHAIWAPAPSTQTGFLRLTYGRSHFQRPWRLTGHLHLFRAVQDCRGIIDPQREPRVAPLPYYLNADVASTRANWRSSDRIGRLRQPGTLARRLQRCRPYFWKACDQWLPRSDLVVSHVVDGRNRGISDQQYEPRGGESRECRPTAERRGDSRRRSSATTGSVSIIDRAGVRKQIPWSARAQHCVVGVRQEVWFTCASGAMGSLPPPRPRRTGRCCEWAP